MSNSSFIIFFQEIHYRLLIYVYYYTLFFLFHCFFLIFSINLTFFLLFNDRFISSYLTLLNNCRWHCYCFNLLNILRIPFFEEPADAPLQRDLVILLLRQYHVRRVMFDWVHKLADLVEGEPLVYSAVHDRLKAGVERHVRVEPHRLGLFIEKDRHAVMNVGYVRRGIHGENHEMVEVIA